MGDLDIFRNHFLGFDNDFFSDFFVKTPNTYPPYNVKENDEKGLIELAVAGFKEKDLKVEVKDNLLSIYGCKEIDDKDISKLYSVHRGIANRNFTRKFKLHEHIVINGAKLEDGMLKIAYHRDIPESKKPKVIKIQS
jgi:molecular chaperone IbpA